MNQLDLTWPPSPDAKPRKKNTASGSYTRRLCDCGNEAVIVLNSFKICQRCYDWDKDRDDRHKECHGELSGNRRELSRMGVGMVYTPVYTKGMDRWDPDNTTSEINYL